MKKRLLLFIGLVSIFILIGCVKWIDCGEFIIVVGLLVL